MTEAEHQKLVVTLTKDIPYLTLMGKLWGVFCDDLGMQVSHFAWQIPHVWPWLNSCCPLIILKGTFKMGSPDSMVNFLPNPHKTWWHHPIETFSALLAICAGNSPGTGEFPAQRPVTRSFDVFFDLCLSKCLSKQSWGWRFETPSHPLWHQCNETSHTSPSWVSYGVSIVSIWGE